LFRRAVSCQFLQSGFCDVKAFPFLFCWLHGGGFCFPRCHDFVPGRNCSLFALLAVSFMVDVWKPSTVASASLGQGRPQVVITLFTNEGGMRDCSFIFFKTMTSPQFLDGGLLLPHHQSPAKNVFARRQRQPRPDCPRSLACNISSPPCSVCAPDRFPRRSRL